MQGGRFNERLVFQRRTFVDDGYGNKEGGDWEDQFEMRANVRPRLGGETVIAQRLTGLQPLLITVRKCSKSDQIQVGWRAKKAANPTVIYDITSPTTDVTGKRKELEMVAQTGIATSG